jgi:NHLM bacteriocin system ABC transporter ATP-binding protein
LEELIAHIRQIGKAKPMTVITPFLMDDPEKVWFIDTGTINIYTVIFENRKPVGKRYYYFTAEAQSLLIGMDSHKSSYQIGFLADATEDSMVYELELSQLKELSKNPNYTHVLAEMLDHWIENIFYGLSENENHPDQPADVLVKEDDKIILGRDEFISSQKNIVWGKIKKDKLENITLNGLCKINSDENEIMIPLSRKSFLQSTKNVGIRFVNTEEALSQEASWWGLRSLENGIFQLEKEEIELVKKQEKDRLELKYQKQFSKVNQALRETELILNKSHVNQYAKKIAVVTEDALFNACQVVVHSLDINLQLFEEMKDNSSDPLGDIARHNKIRHRDVLLEQDWWKKDSGAILGFLKGEDTPLALIPNSKKVYEAYNPITDELFIVNEQTAAKVDKIAYIFYKPFPEKSLNFVDILKFGVFKDYSDVYLLILMAMSGGLLSLVTPVVTGMLLDYVIPNSEKSQIFHVAFGLLTVFFGLILFEITESLALLRIETKMDIRLQSALWDRLLNLPPSFFRSYTTGDLADRASGLNEIRRLLSGVAVTTVLASVFSLFNFFLLFYFSYILAFVALTLVAVFGTVLYLLGQYQVSKEKIAKDFQGKTQGIVLQLLTGISKFRVTGTEIRAFTHWLQSFNKMKLAGFEANQIHNIQSVFTSLIPLISSAVIYTVFMQTETYKGISTGKFLAFNAAFGSFIGAMLAMSGALVSILQIFPLYERTSPILKNLPESDSGKTNPGKLRGDIEVSQLDFKYEKDTPYILQDITMSLTSGDYVAFVGPSGSGKSTLVRLMLGFEKPDSGNIYFDSQAINQLDLRLLRRQIGVVLQDGQLMPGDIFSNIVGSSPQYTIDDAWEAAKMAAIDEDIKQMPMGMHTIINEGSSTISGGQKQRLLIARTLIHKPSIIIFDEATSALDNRTQSIITESLNKLQATRIVIAHRLSTIKDVDKIFVFDKGKIVQEGIFDDLMAVDGLFKVLALRQME